MNDTVFESMATIRGNVFTLIGRLTTTLTISNFCVDVHDGANTASMAAHAHAQHYRDGEGDDPASKGLM